MILAALVLAFAANSGGPVALREGCAADDPQIGLVAASDQVRVLGAISGDEGTCYHLELMRPGKTVSGYVIGETLPAIAAFVTQRERLGSEQLEMMARQAALAAAAPPAGTAAKPAPAPEPPHEVFENFSGRDQKGRGVSLAALNGRIVVVQFWTPRTASEQQLVSLMSLYNQERRSGVSIVGLGVGLSSKNMGEALDDVTLPFPVIPDPGLARHYGVNARAGKTFVLDQSHRIVAAGSAADAVSAVKRLLAQAN